MRAIVMSKHGGPEVLRLVDRPALSPGSGEALVRVAAVAVNRLDIWVREDVGHAYGATLPIVPGYDVAGEVIAVGDAVPDVSPGARVYVHYDFSCGRCPYCLEGDEAACAEYGVMGVNHDGGYAEQVVAPVRNLFVLPDGVSYETAAAAGSVYLTAYHMLFSRAHLRAGETVLVTAAGSGVGGAAIALARFAGARVIATASTEAKRERALAAGVDHAVDYTQAGWGEEVRRLTGGRGVDLVVDHVGAAAVPEALTALANKGPDRHLRRLVRAARRARSDRPLRPPDHDHRLERRIAPRALGGAPPPRRGPHRPARHRDGAAARGRGAGAGAPRDAGALRPRPARSVGSPGSTSVATTTARRRRVYDDVGIQS